jgi:hypothetical protein
MRIDDSVRRRGSQIGTGDTLAPVVRNLQFIVPLENENRWTDLLAVLICTDPAAAAGPLALGDVEGREVTVSREVRGGRDERVDLQVHVDGRLHTVLEAKVLSGLGPTQLSRYVLAYPDAQRFLLVYPGRLVVDPGTGSKWRGISWESVLASFAASSDAWVGQTSAAWLEHLASALPYVHAGTRWNDLQAGDPVPLVMRVRMSWVYGHLAPPAPLTADLMASGGSKGWVARLQTPAAVPGYEIAAEVEDPSARAWPAHLEPGSRSPVSGPRIWVGLRQHDVAGSEGFDWNYLAALWPLMRSARSDWMTTRPGLPAAHDRAAWQRIGAPLGLGYGFGHREATQRHVCMFGARVKLASQHPPCRAGRRVK